MQRAADAEGQLNAAQTQAASALSDARAKAEWAETAQDSAVAAAMEMARAMAARNEALARAEAAEAKIHAVEDNVARALLGLATENTLHALCGELNLAGHSATGGEAARAIAQLLCAYEGAGEAEDAPPT